MESPYGLHLVLVRERVAASVPDLSTIRPLVEREVLAERKKKELHALYERLLGKYTVVIDMPKAAEAKSGAGAGAAP